MSKLSGISRHGVAQAADYADLISRVCDMTRQHHNGETVDRVFRFLGFETTHNKRGWCMRRPGESYWQTQPRILHDFDVAVCYTVGWRSGKLERPLDQGWYVEQMCETTVDNYSRDLDRAGWSVTIAKMHSRAQAIGPTAAAALIAAWLRAHP
jgi:hypothetical protein